MYSGESNSMVLEREKIRILPILGFCCIIKQKINMSEKEMLAFAEQAAKTKYKTETAPFDVIKLLEVKREADKENTLWNVFNRVQEHLVQGGIKGVSESGANIETRPINHIDKNIKVNTGLWSLAEEYLAA